MGMVALKCPACGADIQLDEGREFGFCNYCGTKVMQDKIVVEHQGSIRIDNSASIENYFKMAESAYDSSNQKEAESYCNKIIEMEPENYKAWLLKGKAAGWQSTLVNIRIEESVNCFTKAVDNAPEDDKERVKKEASQEIENLSTALMTMCCNNFVKFASEDNVNSIMNNLRLAQLYSLVFFAKCGVSADGFKRNIAIKINNAAMDAWNNNIYSEYMGSDGHPSKYQWQRYIEQGDYVLSLLQTAIDLCDDDAQNDIVRYKNMIGVQDKLINSWSYKIANGGWTKDYTLTNEAKDRRINKIMEWHGKIKEIDSNYVIPQRPVPKKNGCYVATAVYGSYDCPQVWTLRRYRDYSLALTWYGRLFIALYYAISPTIVKWFGNTNWFNKMWKGRLDKMVKRLQEEGFENTPYDDKNW